MNLVNNNNYGYGYPQPYGYAQAQVPQPKMTQLLTQEQMNILAKQGRSNELQIDENEFLAALCCHRKDNKSVLQATNDGRVYCPICGATFNMVDGLTEETVKDATEGILDVMQTTKAMYVDIGENVGKQFFQIMPLVKRIPALFRLASEDLARYESIGNMQTAQGASGYAVLNTMMSGMGGYPYGYPQQPMYGYQPPQQMAPQGYQPQMAQPGYAYAPQAPMNAAPMYNQGYAPQTAYAPQQDANPFVATGAPAQQPAPMTPPPQQPANAPAAPVVTKNESFGA